jgi:hypothetical protein
MYRSVVFYLACLAAMVFGNPIQVAEWDSKKNAFRIVAKGDGCDVDVLVKTDGALSIDSQNFGKISEILERRWDVCGQSF